MSQVIIPDSSNVITTHPINSSTANNRSHTDFNSGSTTPAAFDQENAMKGLEGKKIFGHQNCQKSDVDDSRS